ncbi:hypothetical protein [Hugenholtzia roseola]|uniref:hypothetical protein n=1 Tax=Hugenholtzia roseola TaxID=1002 RepID=UPI000402227C|nr:hypothetical protein [Hugenholtzia roseola]
MKKIILLLFVFVYSFAFVQAQKIEGTITEFEYNYDTEKLSSTQEKFSYNKISVEKVKDNTVTKIKTEGKMVEYEEVEGLSLMLSSTKVGKYALYSPYYLLDDPEFTEPSAAAAQFSYFVSTQINVEDEDTKKQCIENKIPLTSFIEITKSENNTISGNFTIVLQGMDCSGFMLECLIIFRGSFTDLKID